MVVLSLRRERTLNTLRFNLWASSASLIVPNKASSAGIQERRFSQHCGMMNLGFAQADRGPFVLVDGKQRLEAVRSFLRDEVPVFGGHKCSQLEGRIPNSAFFYFNVNDLGTNAEVLQWYLDLNTGGVVHTTEELDKVRAMLAQEKH
jgi:hypothetical protein